MTSEFKKIKNNEDTHYVLETATVGATSAGVVATAPGKKREDSIETIDEYMYRLTEDKDKKIKKVEYLKSSLTFFINLMKRNICSLDNIVDLGIKLQNEVIHNNLSIEHKEEYINNIFIIIKECIDYLIFNSNMGIMYNNIITIQSMNISKKINFKCMDIIDIIKQYN